MQSQDTITVRTFEFFSESRDSVFTFPDDGPYRKIIMEYRMRCHDLVVGNGNEGCREWDYSCNTIIYDSTRVDSVLVNDGNGNFVYEERTPSRYELLSFVTPYGNGLDLGPNGVMWQFDLTDFAPILKGKKRMALVAGGQYQEEMEIIFHFIKGTPEREVIDIRPIWPLSFGTNVNHIADDIVYEPRLVTFPGEVDAIKLRSVVTGHGQNGEFTAFRHTMKANDIRFDYQVWLDCSNIPVYPQGGTWIFDRAGWCPGDPSQLNEFWVPEDIISTGQVTLDYDIENIRGLAEARYIINNQMVWYGPYNHQKDLEVEAVLRPSDRIEFGRTNPSCYEPQFVIRNRGAENMTSATISYGVVGGMMDEMEWTGDLGPGERDTITVAYPSEMYKTSGGKGRFEVRILTTDDNPDNDYYFEDFDPVPVFDGESVQILLTTNKIATDNELTLVNESNEVILEYKDLQPTRSYFEEVILGEGCYRLLLTDLSGDGLYYWFYERNGSNFGRGGLALFVDQEEVEDFEPEFGSTLQYEFIIGEVTSTHGPGSGYFTVYPNPTDDRIIIETKDYPYDSKLWITDLNGKVLRSVSHQAGSRQTEISLYGLPKGMYQLIWERNGVRSVEKIVKGE